MSGNDHPEEHHDNREAQSARATAAQVTGGGDTITVSDVGTGAAVAAGRGASARVHSDDHLSELVASLDNWQMLMETSINSREELSTEEQQDLKEQIGKIKAEVSKGEKINTNRLEKLISTLAVMGKDIFEVAVTTLYDPLSGIGLTLKKIGDKVKLETKSDTG